MSIEVDKKDSTTGPGRTPGKPSAGDRVLISVGVYLAVAFATSFIGFNLLGAVFFSGPLIGRITDTEGHGISGAFVAYEWKGQTLHGSTGCKAAALVRTGLGGFYVVPWQGWRLFYQFGWGISPLGPAVWAPGYVAIPGGKDGAQLVRQERLKPTDEIAEVGSVDKDLCFGWVYRARLVELRTARFLQTYSRVCAERRTTATADLGYLSGGMTGIWAAQEGALGYGSPQTEAANDKYRHRLEQLSWPQRPNTADVQTTAENRDEYCREVLQDFLAKGGQSGDP